MKYAANRKKVQDRPENDFYPTPSCIVKELLLSEQFPKTLNTILDPCCGKYAIGKVLRDFKEQGLVSFKDLIERDIIYGEDFFQSKDDKHYDCVIMNPPFKFFNQFVSKSKEIADYVFCIGRLNYFGAHDRNVEGLWKNLEWVLPFDRQIAFDKPETEEGLVECGMMVSGWFVWNKSYEGFSKIKVLDMNKYILRKRPSN